jgi:anti-sigma regulatory factor (Ser/Thr protein kinase)
MSSGKVPVTIETIVTDLQTVSWEQVLNEAITNSLQAHATEININFIQNALDLEDTKKYIDSITIEDNGDGFNDINTKSFQEYRTQHKKDLGCKGIGRFLYLKVFDEVNIKSLDKEIKFVIDKDIQVNIIESKLKKTRVTFLKPKKAFVVDYDKLRLDLKEYFIAYFKLLKDKNISVTFNIYDNNIKKFEVKSDDIPTFNNKKIKIGIHEFNLAYILNNDTVHITDGYYCAGGRVVIKNSHLDSNKKLKLFKDIKIVYLLSSDYLDNNVNETRDNFTILPKRKNSDDLFHNLSWNEIQTELKNQIKIIAKDNGVDIEKIAKENRLKALNEAPFLAYYLQKNENNDDYETLKKYAEKMLKEDKQFIRDNSDKMDDTYQEKLAIITQSELAEYIYDRQKIIDKLKEITNNESLEKEVHNLFMQQNTTDENKNYKSNNLWLFDDRFMSYDKVFSEAEIKSIFPELANNVKRPDILSLVSNTNNKDKITDIVIIELKRPKEIITPEGAEAQLLKYARYINQSNLPNDVRIWTYAFLKFNKDIDDDLDDKDYNKIPTHWEHPIYYKYHEKRNTIINFMDYRALAFDANNRNKTFMKILSGETIESEES